MKRFPFLLSGQPRWGNPWPRGLGAEEGTLSLPRHPQPAPPPRGRLRRTRLGSPHAAGGQCHGGRRRRLRRQIAVSARGTAETPPASFRAALERSGTAAHWLARLALPRATSCDPRSAIGWNEHRFPDKAFLESRLAGFTPLFIVVSR